MTFRTGAASAGTARESDVGRVLVVDDDPTVADVVARYLRRDGHEVECVADGRTALERATAVPPDLVVLDLMLPGMDGLDVCVKLREQGRRGLLPVIMLTALGDEVDRVAGLEIGADDYVTKPFSPRELALRVRSVLRRARGEQDSPDRPGGHTRHEGQPGRGQEGPEGSGAERAGPATEVVRDGALVMDIGAHEVWLDGVRVSLTAREFDLLVFLARRPRRAFARRELLEHVWGWSFGDLSTVTVHVRRLRGKVEADSASPLRIVTVWGVGYRYEPEAAS